MTGGKTINSFALRKLHQSLDSLEGDSVPWQQNTTKSDKYMYRENEKFQINVYENEEDERMEVPT